MGKKRLVPTLSVLTASVLLIMTVGPVYSAHNGTGGEGLDCDSYTVPDGFNLVTGVGYIVGTNNNDVIFGSSGNDLIYGLGGDDIICGNGGNDIINGGEGDDDLFGNSGRDVLSGGPGNDDLDGGAVLDVCGGGPGNDDAVFCESTSEVP
ncbi:MAG: calcium-binding protein [Nitrososphaerales archaeon]